MKKAPPKIDIHRLREIGWSLWDPIGLSRIRDGWRGEPFEDEYDQYLVKTAGMLRKQRPASEVIDYLFLIETEHMGLGVGPNEAELRESLLKLVRAISDDPSIWSDGFTVELNLSM